MTALNGIRVLDLSEGIAPSVAGMLLADFGADVVKVESPGGDRTRRHPGSVAWNRGKRSVTVAKDSGSDVAWLAESLLGADVCVLGVGQELSEWGPDVVEAAGQNARLVLVSMPAYLDSDTPWLGGRESNAFLSAQAGVSWRQSSEDGNPVDPVYPHLLYVHAVWAAVCIVSALLERETSGYGQKVTVTGINAVMVAAVYSLSVDPNAPDPDTAIGSLGRHPTYRPIRARDKWLACGALGPKFETALLHILGIESILDDPRLGGCVQNMVLPENLAWSTDQVARTISAQSRDHWVDLLSANGIPAGPLLDRADWLDHPQVVANGLRVEIEDPERGRVVMPGVPLTLTRTPGSVRAAAPVLGQDNGCHPWSAQPRPEGTPVLSPGPLSKYRIMDMGTFIASPYAGTLLAELGADVIKVEPKTGDPFRGSAFTVNRGMRSLAIDLATPGGQAIFRRVSAGADAVIDGMRPGVMTKLGIDHDALSTVNPSIVTMSLAAYGMNGDLARSGGVDMVLQAMSGMMLAQGEDDQPVSNSTAIIDVTTAVMSALAVVIALFHRERTGEGQHAWDSLLGTSTFLGLGELVRFDGRESAPRGGVDFKGPAVLDRFYAVTDGWIRVQADGQDTVTVDDLKQAGLPVEDISVAGIADAVAALPGRDAVSLLSAAGIPSVVARKISELFHDDDLKASEFIHFRRADDGSVIATPGRCATFSRTQRHGPMTPPGIGEHTEDVLREAGISTSDVAQALAAGVVVAGRPNPITLVPIYR